MAGLSFSYRSQGFSLQRDKSRFVLPREIRKTVKDSSGDTTVLCLVKHDRWPCLSGFGLSRVDEFEDELDVELERKLKAGEPFDRELKAMQLYGYSRVPFDGSGRFIMPEHLAALAGITNRIFINGLGAFFTIWSPDELEKMQGTQWDNLKATCRLLERDALKAKD